MRIYIGIDGDMHKWWNMSINAIMRAKVTWSIAAVAVSAYPGGPGLDVCPPVQKNLN